MSVDVARKAHKHWQARAADYRQMAADARSPEVRQVLLHLTLVCSEMAKATDSSVTPRASLLTIHPNDVVREASGQRWRMREAEYRAIADNCETDAGKQAWLTIAGRCDELADYLEKT